MIRTAIRICLHLSVEGSLCVAQRFDKGDASLSHTDFHNTRNAYNACPHVAAVALIENNREKKCSYCKFGAPPAHHALLSGLFRGLVICSLIRHLHVITRVGVVCLWCTGSFVAY